MKTLSLLFAVFIASVAGLSGTVIPHELPAEFDANHDWVMPSTQYRVEVLQGDTVTKCPTYMMEAQHTTNRSETTSWAQFDFEGEPVKIRVYKLEGEIDHHAVLPSSKGITPRKGDGYVEFTIEKPGQFAVDFEEGVEIAHPMVVFANPMETRVPTKGDPGVIWFEPGVHEIGDNFELESDTTVYLERGAYVKGRITAYDKENIKILGRGILSGEVFPVRSGGFLINLRGSSGVNNILIEGITVLHAPSHNIVLEGYNHIVRNVKILSWHFSTDGIKAGKNSVVEDCFMKVNDDSIRLYDTNSVARRNIIWQMDNGAPFQIGWSGGSSRHFHAYDCDVIRVEHQFDNENESVFCAIKGTNGERSHYLYEDIRVENCDWRIFRIVTMPNRWAHWDPEGGSVANVHFKNITIKGEQKLRSIIKGHDPKHPVYNITFENVEMNGKLIRSAEEGNIFVDPNTTWNVKFVVTE